MRMILALLVTVMTFPIAADADIIIFKSGSAKINVIVEEENAKQVKFRDKDKVVTVMRSNVEKIEYAAPDENKALRFKWEEEKQRLAEERKKRKEAEKKFAAEQKAKGLIEVDGKWMSVGEAEARRQKALLQQVQRQQQQSAAKQKAEKSEELELPEYADDLTEDQKALLMEDLKRQQKVKVGQIRMVDLGNGRVQLKGVVTNGSNMAAKKIYIQLVFYDENGDVLNFANTTVYSVQPGATGSFHVPVSLSGGAVKRTEAQIQSISW